MLLQTIDPPATYGRRPARPDATQLAQAHMALVRRIAWHVHGRVSNAVDVEDLIQVGMVALVEAAQGFEDRGHAFATYASMRIRGAMIDELRRHATLARGAMSRRRDLARARSGLETRLGRAPTEAEMAEAMGLDAAAYRALADSAEAVRQESLDEVYSDQSMWFADVEERADEAIDRRALSRLLADGIGKLPEREAMVLQLYFVEELNLEEIGQVLGVTNARVCQIKKSALDKLRAGLKGRV
ncbi:FliA/WhiG family RNA polymerase sigma factor [Sphingomonas jatrophae]|uniref:RNA polymerase, sigma 28 subunit, SigD/FliA/WhiG n=1 Tax=Sphingomonas jatrophae TaxID=1166337 RepID=A0A1I6MAV8_9SPHN|nr:FliA/WhiG family RNA polymerase sigma factor [Sphingomonas jatrophae]SFS12860.1 RNA polymerase, sigma 28 subunit, SigD/FliA/WhiG [Sphingomonas jatrophae]